MHDIYPFLPEPFDNPGTLLYIGAREDAHSWLDELYQAGNLVTVLEVWPPNFQRLIGYPAIHDLVSGDVRQVDDLFTPGFNFDYIFWWHGPEHLQSFDLEPTLKMLESRCNKVIMLACPYGIYNQGSHEGNPHEAHQNTLYPADFEYLGYYVMTDGKIDEVGSEIVAWKVIGQ